MNTMSITEIEARLRVEEEWLERSHQAGNAQGERWAILGVKHWTRRLQEARVAEAGGWKPAPKED